MKAILAMMAKIEWTKKSNEASPYAVMVPDTRVKARDFVFTSYPAR